MPKRKSKNTPEKGRHYTLLDSGVIVAARPFEDLVAPYRRCQIPDYLRLVDHDLEIAEKRDYKKQLADEEERLNTLVRQLEEAGRSLIIVFQGRDAAGKSGATERIMSGLDYDMKIFRSIPIGPPTEEERAHPYLWRFFKGERMPEFGQVRVFDRSWAERVLVERVMKLTPTADIRASYAELRAFEWLLVQQGGVLAKFWLDITKDEQLARFKARCHNKPWKINPSDQEARKHWKGYSAAANEMFFRTGTCFAPWHIVSSENKWYSRVTVLKTINLRLEEQLT